MKTTIVVRASVVAALALGMIGVSAGTASARVPARCDGTVQTVSTLGGGLGSMFGTVERWTNWVLKQDAAGHTVLAVHVHQEQVQRSVRGRAHDPADRDLRTLIFARPAPWTASLSERPRSRSAPRDAPGVR